MNTIPNPDDWMDVITIIAVALIAGVPSWFAIKANKTSTEVLNQTRNGRCRKTNAPVRRTTPMRQDLDRAIESLDRLGHEVSGIRTDLADEEDRRREHVREVHISVQELRDDVQRKLDDLHARLKP